MEVQIRLSLFIADLSAVSVRNCVFPWHWMLVTNDGDVMPCSHGSAPVGNLLTSTAEEIWNGPLMQEVRGALLRGEVHRVCHSSECPFQREHPAFPERAAPLSLDEEFAQSFNEAAYLADHPDVGAQVEEGRFASGLEHFVRHGRHEGRSYRLTTSLPTQAPVVAAESIDEETGDSGPRRESSGPPAPLENATLGLVEYSRGAVELRAHPVDVVLAVTTICNLRCVMCPQGMEQVTNPHHMPVSVVERARQVLESATRIIISGVGEPTTAPAFWWVVDHMPARRRRFVRANTNGHFLDDARAARIASSCVTELSVSLDAARPETYHKIRGGDFDRVLTAVKVLMRARSACPTSRIFINVNMTLMRENVFEAAMFVALARRLAVDGVVFTQLFTFGDVPTWRVRRGAWEFVYSEQMIAGYGSEVRRHLEAASQCARNLGVPVFFRDNTASHLLAGREDQPVRAAAPDAA
ncbi:MAG TPA: radical SAM protein [Opitutaceae bacterium]|nr:radical SAM protein [Opitutaceae bacterium]HND61455.1 radical SAM protein [Opitutaceae bacterium]